MTTDSKSKNNLNDLQAYARNNGTVDSFEGNQEWIILSLFARISLAVPIIRRIFTQNKRIEL